MKLTTNIADCTLGDLAQAVTDMLNARAPLDAEVSMHLDRASNITEISVETAPPAEALTKETPTPEGAAGALQRAMKMGSDDAAEGDSPA